MPTVAVYVPADMYRRLGSEDARVREIALGALEREAGLGSGEVARADSLRLPAAASPVPSPDDVPGAAVTGDAAIDGEARRGVIPPRPRVRISPSSGSCPADTPRGVRCKLCGEKH